MSTRLVGAVTKTRPKFFEVDGRILWSDHEPRSLGGMGSRPLEERQRDQNRHFVVANLLDGLGITDWEPDELVPVAEAWAEAVGSALRTAHPQRRFEIEVVGREGVEHEPLELCITFWEPS